MFSRILIIKLIMAIAVNGMGMNVPSQGEPAPDTDGEQVIGGTQYTETELILIIVGAVLGTVVLLSILN